MTVAADGQPRGRPMTADVAYQPAQMTANFVSRWGPSGSQQNRSGPGLTDAGYAGGLGPCLILVANSSAVGAQY